MTWLCASLYLLLPGGIFDLLPHSCSVYWQLLQLRSGQRLSNSRRSLTGQIQSIQDRYTQHIFYRWKINSQFVIPVVIIYLHNGRHLCKCVYVFYVRVHVQLYIGSVNRWMRMLLTESGNDQVAHIQWTQRRSQTTTVLLGKTKMSTGVSLTEPTLEVCNWNIYSF